MSGVKREYDAAFEELNAEDQDYNKLMEHYQDKFYKAYTKSQALWKAEKVQRQALYAYQRKVNAILDLLSSYEEDNAVCENAARIENLCASLENPTVRRMLRSLRDLRSTAEISNLHRLNLYLTESIPDVVGDEVDHLEVNPQDAEAWVRRSYPHLVVSKFKPITVMSTSIQNTIEATQGRPAPKRRRKPATATSLPPPEEGLDTK